MKYFFAFLCLLTADLVFAQIHTAEFLVGTWKVQNREVYERWDKLNDFHLKGISYKIVGGAIHISEYLDIQLADEKLMYTATVLNQNQGRGISFGHIPNDSLVVFENMEHDFPKRIAYHYRSDSSVYVQVSDGGKRGFGYIMYKTGQKTIDHSSGIANPNYDPKLAEQYEADDYGMKSYVLVVLKTGSNTTQDQELIRASFQGHMDNINKLVSQGNLIVAGPMAKNDQTYRGIFILNVKTYEEARILISEDKAIELGLLDYELYTWYGSAALSGYLELADKIWKIKP